MNRRNFLSMLSALPFVRGLSVPKSETAIPVEPPPEVPVEDWPVEFSIDGQVYRAKNLHVESELWEDWSRPTARRGTTGRQTIRFRGLKGWGLPFRVCNTVELRLLKPADVEWTCMLISRREDSDEHGLVTHVEFITDREGTL